MRSRMVGLILLLALGCSVNGEESSDGWENVLQCVFQPNLAECLEQRSVRALQGFVETAEKTELSPDDKELADELSVVLDPLVPEEEEEEETRTSSRDAGEEEGEDKSKDVLEEGRGKKKKKKRAVMKLVMVMMLLKNKIGLLFSAFGTLLQIKFFGIAVLNLLFTLFRLYLDLTRNKQPQKVIYYEHAQHQHHYEHEHHYDDENKGSWGSLWGRSITDQEEDAKADAAHGLAYNSYRPRQAS
ncbi:uncharacterized protein [Anabrus simplex]|uniref:uncharacterized protein n=1 Tax=Anabrus simplex TaxID=316456 RepID=UPI0035A37A5F